MKKIIYLFTTVFSGVVLSCLLSSCFTNKKLVYFNNLTHDTVMQVQQQSLEPTIAKHDILSITISTLDEATTRQLNAAITSTAPGSSPGYLVDENGVVKLSFLGTIKAEGLTKKQLSDYITNELLNRKLAKEPIVAVRIENFKVTVIGEVVRPGNIPVPNERITLIEALAAAGDLTPYGNREDIRLIREANGKRITKIININKGDVFEPEVFNLRNQDVIYVSPIKGKAATTDRSAQYLSIIVSVVSLLVVIYAQFIK